LDTINGGIVQTPPKSLFIEPFGCLANYLIDHGFIQALVVPDDEYYLVLCVVNSVSWLNSNLQFNQKIFDDLQNNKAGLILNPGCDSIIITPRPHSKSIRSNNNNLLELIKKSAEYFHIDAKNILYVDCNYKVNRILKKYNLNGQWFNFWEALYPPLDIDTIVSSIKNKKSREKKFLYFGGRPREFRLRFINELLKIPNFLNDAYVSTGSGHVLDHITKEKKYIKEIHLDKQTIYGYDPQFGRSKGVHIALSELHLDSYINIVPMSYFEMSHDGMDLDEKPIKPIVGLQPFILLGEPGLLQYLRDIGYKTFHPFIDETYDTTLDDDERFDKIVAEVNRLSSLTYDELDAFMIDILPILEHNAKLQRERFINKDSTLIDRIYSFFRPIEKIDI